MGRRGVGGWGVGRPSLLAARRESIGRHRTPNPFLCPPPPRLSPQFLTALQSGATQVSTDATTISTDLSAALLPQLDAVGQAAGALQTDVSALATAFAGLGGALDSTAGVLTATSDAYGDLLRPTTSGGHPQGLVVGAMADLATVPRVASGGGFPDTATLAAASGAPGDLTTPGTQNRMVSRAVIGNPAEMLALVGRLQAVYASLAPPTATVANYTATGAALRAVAARVASAQADLVPAVRGNVSALEAALAALPSGAAVTAHLLALNASVYAVDLSTIRGAVVSITAAVAALPSFDTLLAELRTVQALPDVLPCVRTLTDQLAGINATLARLPDSLGGLTGLYDSLNASIVSAVAAVGGAEAQLVAANASLAGFAASNNYTAQIDDLLATLQQKRAEVDLPSLLAHVGDLDAGVGGLNFTAIGVTVDALDTALGSVSPAAVTTAAGVLEAWGAFTANLTAQLERAAAPTRAGLNPAGDYALAARAYCSGNSQFFCDADADCVVAGTDHGPCFTAAAGSARCSAGAQSVPCNVDADCSGGAYCLVDLDRAVGLAWVLGAAQDPSLPPDMAAVAGSLSAMASTATGLDPGAPLVDIATAQGAVAGIDTTSASAALAGVVAALGAIDLSGINATLASVKDEIAQVPFASVSSQITSIQGTVDDLVNSKRPLVQDALMVRAGARARVVRGWRGRRGRPPRLPTASSRLNRRLAASALPPLPPPPAPSLLHTLQAARALRGLLFDEMPVYLARMSRANLTAALAARGPGGMLEGLVAGVADDAVAYVKRSQSLVDVNVPALAPTVDDYTPYIDKAAAAPGPYADADDHGAAVSGRGGMRPRAGHAPHGAAGAAHPPAPAVTHSAPPTTPPPHPHPLAVLLCAAGVPRPRGPRGRRHRQVPLHRRQRRCVPRRAGVRHAGVRRGVAHGAQRGGRVHVVRGAAGRVLPARRHPAVPGARVPPAVAARGYRHPAVHLGYLPLLLPLQRVEEGARVVRRGLHDLPVAVPVPHHRGGVAAGDGAGRRVRLGAQHRRQRECGDGQPRLSADSGRESRVRAPPHHHRRALTASPPPPASSSPAAYPGLWRLPVPPGAGLGQRRGVRL